MDRSSLSPEMRKVYEDLDTLDFEVSMARENPGMYTPEEIKRMAHEYPQLIVEVAQTLHGKFDELPDDVRERARYHVHHTRDMTDVREWIAHVQDNLDWVTNEARGL